MNYWDSLGKLLCSPLRLESPEAQDGPTGHLQTTHHWAGHVEGMRHTVAGKPEGLVVSKPGGAAKATVRFSQRHESSTSKPLIRISEGWLLRATCQAPARHQPTGPASALPDVWPITAAFSSSQQHLEGPRARNVGPTGQ